MRVSDRFSEWKAFFVPQTEYMNLKDIRTPRRKIPFNNRHRMYMHKHINIHVCMQLERN